jgi:hypothetical protein
MMATEDRFTFFEEIVITSDAGLGKIAKPLSKLTSLVPSTS